MWRLVVASATSNTGNWAATIALGALAALLHSPFGPASRAAVPNLAGEADLTWANGTLAAASNVGQLAGPALGGVLYAFSGAGVAFAANAVSFVVSAAFIAAVRGRFRGENPEAERAHRRRAASGQASASFGTTARCCPDCGELSHVHGDRDRRRG